MITYEELPPSAQKAYKFTNNIRKITMFIGWVLTIIFAILLNTLLDHGIRLAFYDMILLLFSGMMLGAVFHGLFHFEFLGKKGIRTFGIIGGYFICVLLFGCSFVAGPIFLIIDTILFCLKKPLVYPFENKCFLNSKKAQNEIEVVTWDDYLQSQSSESAMATLQTLKDLLEKGVISVDEFNIKKAELLERI